MVDADMHAVLKYLLPAYLLTFFGAALLWRTYASRQRR